MSEEEHLKWGELLTKDLEDRKARNDQLQVEDDQIKKQEHDLKLKQGEVDEFKKATEMMSIAYKNMEDIMRYQNEPEQPETPSKSVEEEDVNMENLEDGEIDEDMKQ